MAMNPPITDWHGRRVWLLGGSTGIGAELAKALSAQGARLALSARNPVRLAELAGSLGALALPLDVGQADQLQAAHARLQAEWGGLDVAILNAGTYAPVSAKDIQPGWADELMRTNLLGIMDAVACVLPDMLHAGQGHIVLVGSVAGYRGLPKALAYGPSKAALINFAESLFLDVARAGIGVTLVSPGFVRTPLTAQNDFRMPALMEPDEAARRILAGLARGKFEIHFPRRFTLLLKCLRLLPAWAYLKLLERTVKT